MSLVSFHRGLIAAAIVFCFGYAGWEAMATGRGTGGSMLVGALFLVLGLGLTYYLIRLNRFLGYERGEGRRPE